MKRILIICTLFLSLFLLGTGSFQLQAQHLKRRANLGFRPAPISDSLAKARNIEGGILVTNLNSEGTLGKMGVLEDDILIEINGLEISNWDAARPIFAQRFEGDQMEITVSRLKGKKVKQIQLQGNVVGIPKEASTSAYDVEYGEAPFQNGFLRTITNLPKSPGPHPILYFIPGYNCFSIDNMPGYHPYRKMIDSLTKLGNIVYRVDKPGMGDGPSPCNCTETGFETELQAFEAGYRHLLKQSFASEARIFIFGHSMGGIQAPLMTAQKDIHPKGIAVYGTVFQTWYEYILNMLRFQEPRSGEAYIAFEADMQEYIKLMYAHYVEFKPLSEITANPRWEALLKRDFLMDEEGNLLFRKAEYWQEIAKHSLTEAWAKTDAHVLSIFGEADFEVFNAFSMAEIARIVNAYHPGNGTFTELKGSDHSMIKVGTMEEGVELRGSPLYRDFFVNQFNYDIITILDDWMNKTI